MRMMNLECDFDNNRNIGLEQSVLQSISEERDSIDISELNAIVLAHPSVLGVRSFELENRYVFAVLTVPIYLKSERDALQQTLRSEIKNAINNGDVTVSFNINVYRNITENMNDELKQRLAVKAENG